MKFFEKLLEKAKNKKIKTIVVAAAGDEDVILAVEKARNVGIIKAILVGDEKKILEIFYKYKILVSDYEILDYSDVETASEVATKIIHDGKGDILMKGFVDTSIILKAVLSNESNLRIEGNLLSHVAIFDIVNQPKIRLVTDAAMNIEPTLEEKKKILENTVQVAHLLEIPTPKVAVLCAKEKVSPKMQATIDAEKLQKMNESKEIENCIVVGPIALDGAISKESALHKNMKGAIMGDADILLVPNIESGNILYKALTYFCESESAGLIVGAKVPIVLTSRSDSDETKFNSILLSTIF